ncbi:MAG: hypothetical protein HY470_00875 [Candidatus Ryanbacteria bacterium]|nr:hypothetical protein [Candidatus Ryanbacteria bacterium]
MPAGRAREKEEKMSIENMVAALTIVVGAVALVFANALRGPRHERVRPIDLAEDMIIRDDAEGDE